jgi:hypothetical protein
VGGKHFVMAVWQTGMTWAPPSDLLNTIFNAALRHIATHFASWTRRLARSVANHKANPQTEEARIRSGTSKGKHGLNPQQMHDREERRDARCNYYRTVLLENKLHASKGKAKGKGRGATEHSVQPSRNWLRIGPTAESKAWADMSQSERWWLKELWNGHLLNTMKETEAKCHRVQAPRFRVPVDIS